jgi:hypothetical protein
MWVWLKFRTIFCNLHTLAGTLIHMHICTMVVYICLYLIVSNITCDLFCDVEGVGSARIGSHCCHERLNWRDADLFCCHERG